MTRNKTLFQIGALVTLLLVALLVGSVTYARYRQAVEQEVGFTAKTLTENGAFLLASANGWQTTESGATLAFALSFEGDSAKKRPAVLRLTATQAMSEDVLVTLTVGDAVYTAARTPIAQGSALYAQMGAGYEFRFADENGEMTWQPNGIPMHLMVQGASDTAMLRLTVDEK